MDERRPLLVTCQYCQAQAPPEAVHCPSCGQPLPRHLLLQGEVVCDDYQIVRLIGYGGMGEVYLAQHHLTGQQVAIKVLALHLAEEVDLRIRFLDEARILARLDHPNIVMLHNFKQERDRMHIIMQYVDGVSLDRIIEQHGPMDAEQAVLLFAPLADALHHAHENGIIHRDLKPSNILVNQAGKARLTDFGIAKLTEGGANLTRTGTRVGTSWFMSPEQGLNKPADSRSDIYALAVTLYNCLSGRLPFYGDSEYEVIKGHVELVPPPLFSGDDPLEREVEQVVMQALAKDPAARFPTGNAMRDALLSAVTRYGHHVDLRATGNGSSRGAVPRGRGGSGPAAPPPLPAGVVASPPTTLDPVEELHDLGDPLPTPPLGSVSRVGTPGNGVAPRLNAGEAHRVPEATHPPAGRREGVVEPGRLQTPSGRPPAPGMSIVATGVMLREEAGQEALLAETIPDGAPPGPTNGAPGSPPASPLANGEASGPGARPVTRERVAVASDEAAQAPPSPAPAPAPAPAPGDTAPAPESPPQGGDPGPSDPSSPG